MQLVLLIPEYILWHYSKAIQLTLNIVSNFLWFVYHFFSIPILVTTLLAPLKGVGKDFAPFSRLLGFFIKVATIFLAYLILTLVAIAGLVLICVWVLLPFIVIGLLFHGFEFLFV